MAYLNLRGATRPPEHPKPPLPSGPRIKHTYLVDVIKGEIKRTEAFGSYRSYEEFCNFCKDQFVEEYYIWIDGFMVNNPDFITITEVTDDESKRQE